MQKNEKTTRASSTLPKGSHSERLLKRGEIWIAEPEKKEEQQHKLEEKDLPSERCPLIELESGVIHEFFGKQSLPSFLPLSVVTLLVGDTLSAHIEKSTPVTFPKGGSDALRVTTQDALRVTTQKEEVLRCWNRYIFWIGRECWPSPYVLQRALPYPEMITSSIFIDLRGNEERLWALDTVLRSEAAATVVAYVPKLSLAQSKRFSLALSGSNRFAFLFRPPEAVKTTSTAATRWKAIPCPPEKENQYSPRWRLSLLKKKGTQVRRREWIVESREPFFTSDRTMLVHCQNNC